MSLEGRLTGSRDLGDLVRDSLADVERTGAWDWLLELDKDAMIEALAEWLDSGEMTAPVSQEHLAMACALVAYWHGHRASEIT